MLSIKLETSATNAGPNLLRARGPARTAGIRKFWASTAINVVPKWPQVMNARTAMRLIRQENSVGNAEAKFLTMVKQLINQLKSRKSRVQNVAKSQIAMTRMDFLFGVVVFVGQASNTSNGRPRNVLRKLWFSGPERSLLFKLWSAG